MTTKIEQMQRDALEQLSGAVERERAAAAERNAMAEVCRDVGVSVNRMSAEVGVSRGQIYTWLRSAMPGGGAAAGGESTSKPAKRSASKRAATGGVTKPRSSPAGDESPGASSSRRGRTRQDD